MVRMGSPVRFRRGLHTKPAGQAGSGTRPLPSSEVGNCRLPEICQSDLYTVSRCGPAARTMSPSLPGARPPVRPTRPCGPCAGVIALVLLGDRPSGSALGRLQTMSASRPAIPSTHRLPTPTRIGGCDCWSCIARSPLDGSGGPVAETLASATATLRQTPSCSQLSRCSSQFESSTGTRIDQRFKARRHERSLSRIDFSRARSLRFARLIAPAIAGATMVPNPDGRPRLRNATIVAPLGVSENV